MGLALRREALSSPASALIPPAAPTPAHDPDRLRSPVPAGVVVIGLYAATRVKNTADYRWRRSLPLIMV